MSSQKGRGDPTSASRFGLVMVDTEAVLLTTITRLIQRTVLQQHLVNTRSSLVPRPIPSFSACNIEKLGMGLGTRLTRSLFITFDRCYWITDYAPEIVKVLLILYSKSHTLSTLSFTSAPLLSSSISCNWQ